jgi:hypothetical protein
MDARPDDQPEPVMLIIADISGYTRYMTANVKTLTHSQTVVTELIKAILKQIELPLEVAKLEGDAVFLYCRKQFAGCAPQWPAARRIIGQKLLTFFHMFNEKLNELSQSVTCTCSACTHIEKLRLKVVVHSGEALFHRVYNFVELAGVDVILIHRLLKNSVKADQYLLLTEAARGDVEFAEPIQLRGGVEAYEDLGQIKTLVYLPGEVAVESVAPVKTSFRSRFCRSWELFFKLWFAPLKAAPDRLKKGGSGPASNARTGLAVLTALLTPIYLPVGTMFVFFHALRSPAKRHHPGDDHVHKADGSCCGEH